MGQKAGKKWTAEAVSQPTFPKPDRLLDWNPGLPACLPACRRAGGRAGGSGAPGARQTGPNHHQYPAQETLHAPRHQLWRFETKSVHAGYSPEATTHAVAVPIYQTAAYSFDSAQHGADLFDLKVAGNIYTRIMNPTQAVLEEWVAALEGGIAALAVASGQAAVTYAIQTIAEAGDNIVSSSALYGGTYNLFAHTLPQYGINTRFADDRNPATFAPLIDANTKAIFVESLGNPSGNVTLHPRHSRYRPPARHRAHRRPAGRPDQALAAV